MSSIRKQLLRTAVTVHQRLLPNTQNYETVKLPPWESVSRLARQLDTASCRGWYRAAARLKQDLVHEMNSLCQRVANVVAELASASNSVRQLSAADVYADLVALEEEFEKVIWDRECQQLRVTTEPIELDGMDFGRFQVCLELNSRSAGRSYHVVALDPRPAACNESVTHPHISNEDLCEGDGREAIRSALDSGRLYDFFMVVGRLLNTYAPGRAYVELDNWDGTPCEDCGAIVGEEERWTCEHCGAASCRDCLTGCSQCGSSHCSNCLSICPACDQPNCASCLNHCGQCRRAVCADCLEAGYCPRCRHQEPDDEEPISTASPNLSATAPADPALQSHGMGQTASLA